MHRLVLFTLLGFSACSGHFSVHQHQHQRTQNNLYPQGPLSPKLPSLPTGAARALPSFSSHTPASPFSNSIGDLQNYYNQLITRRNQIQVNSRSRRLGLPSSPSRDESDKKHVRISNKVGIRPATVLAPQKQRLSFPSSSSRDESDKKHVRTSNSVGIRPATVLAPQRQRLSLSVSASRDESDKKHVRTSNSVGIRQATVFAPHRQRLSFPSSPSRDESDKKHVRTSYSVGIRPATVLAPQRQRLSLSSSASRDESDKKHVRTSNIVGIRPETVFATQVQLVAVPVMTPHTRLSPAQTRDDVPTVESSSLSKPAKSVITVSSLRAAAYDLDCDSMADLLNLVFSEHRPLSCDDDKCPAGRHCNKVQGHGFCCPKSVTEWDIESRARLYFW